MTGHPGCANVKSGCWSPLNTKGQLTPDFVGKGSMENYTKDIAVVGDAEYKGKIYRIDIYNPIDGYRLRTPDGGLTDPFWVPVKAVKILTN